MRQMSPRSLPPSDARAAFRLRVVGAFFAEAERAAAKGVAEAWPPTKCETR
jgi:hypothetical protein